MLTVYSPYIKLPFSPLTFDDQDINLAFLKQKLEQFTQWNAEQFKNQAHIETLIHNKTQFIDELLCRLCHYFDILTNESHTNKLSFIAVGGYGRGELHPLSDIDILILSENALSSNKEHQITEFLRLLWDLHLDIGSSVRTFSQCLQDAKSDITIMTNLLESRYICSDKALLEQLHHHIFSENLWDLQTFFDGKIAEQNKRYEQYHLSSYNLEPDIKNSPGGLRDIHIIQWIALKTSKNELNKQEKTPFLTQDEMAELNDCRLFLWKIFFVITWIILFGIQRSF